MKFILGLTLMMEGTCDGCWKGNLAIIKPTFVKASDGEIR